MRKKPFVKSVLTYGSVIFVLLLIVVYRQGYICVNTAITVLICTFGYGFALVQGMRFFLIRKRNRCSVVIVTVIPAALLLAGLIVFGMINPENQNHKRTYQEYQKATEKDALANHMEEVSKLETYADLGVDKKMNLVNVLTRIECRYLGMEETPQIRIQEMEEDEDEVLGYYEVQSDTLTISDKIFYGESGYELVYVLAHEIRHRYQYQQVFLLDQLAKDRKYDKYLSLKMFELPVGFEKELEDYVNGREDYEKYSSQWVEQDSNQYAEQSVTDIRKEIQAYLSKAE